MEKELTVAKIRFVADALKWMYLFAPNNGIGAYYFNKIKFFSDLADKLNDDEKLVLSIDNVDQTYNAVAAIASVVEKLDPVEWGQEIVLIHVGALDLKRDMWLRRSMTPHR